MVNRIITKYYELAQDAQGTGRSRDSANIIEPSINERVLETGHYL
jgi:hypothetical protein